ncbi:hypothetical protein MX659_04050 [Coriobacteriia bacterium Es71-Z0120]|uniref:hypothetical protein n=1 Tax=Parvivirga hydrogeniphila TaxID=2939460 RepID=UPI002260F2FB|nr:hypothetical protein [Parvivirga hydrogeniphila]MCL4078771.1 hypothetical protein [Parvivirga hydrogeniphila]
MLDSVRGVMGVAGACAFGLLLGLGFAFLSRFAVSFIRPGRVYVGLAVISSLTFVRLVVYAAMLAACSAIAPGVMAPFGISLVTAFLATTVVEGIREIRSVSSGITA